MSHLYVYSGECCQCRVGEPVGHADINGKPLHTGDIVITYHVEHAGTDHEVWDPGEHLSVVVRNQFQSYVGGAIELNESDDGPFVMGVKKAGFNDPKWKFLLVKHHGDVIAGEHWAAYGFNYKHNPPADALIAQLNKEAHNDSAN